MATFYKCMNNGTIAIVPEEVYRRIEYERDLFQRWEQESGGLEPKVYPPYPRPIFTFVRPDHYERTHLRNFVTGDYQLMDELLNGHIVIERPFYVPFSNSTELNEGEDGPEHRFRMTVAEVIEAFELVRKPVEVA